MQVAAVSRPMPPRWCHPHLVVKNPPTRSPTLQRLKSRICVRSTFWTYSERTPLPSIVTVTFTLAATSRVVSE
eukprot:5368341-Prymnesium_polylepis.2